jgi:hypothetical protein
VDRQIRLEFARTLELVRLLEYYALVQAHLVVRRQDVSESIAPVSDKTPMKIRPKCRIFEIGIHAWK